LSPKRQPQVGILPEPDSSPLPKMSTIRNPDLDVPKKNGEPKLAVIDAQSFLDNQNL
jgi:hypothetical protein